jgi:hypothetical protein
MTKTLLIKEAPGYVTDDGQQIPIHTLYRFVDENGKGGCWYSKIEQAGRSWDRAHGPDFSHLPRPEDGYVGHAA